MRNKSKNWKYSRVTGIWRGFNSKLNWTGEQERRRWGVTKEGSERALTTAEHLWASCARRRHTAPQTRPPPWGRSGRTPRSRARSPGGLTCGGQTWCCWVSQSARLPPRPAIMTIHRHGSAQGVNNEEIRAWLLSPRPDCSPCRQWNICSSSW